MALYNTDSYKMAFVPGKPILAELYIESVTTLCLGDRGAMTLSGVAACAANRHLKVEKLSSHKARVL